MSKTPMSWAEVVAEMHRDTIVNHDRDAGRAGVDCAAQGSTADLRPPMSYATEQSVLNDHMERRAVRAASVRAVSAATDGGWHEVVRALW